MENFVSLILETLHPFSTNRVFKLIMHITILTIIVKQSLNV
jgi:hypothetical protein